MPALDPVVPARLSAPLLLALAILLAVGVAGGGYLAGRGVILARLADRFVTVKGVAEIDARANLAIYPVSFVVTSDDLAAGKTRVDEQIAQARAFFIARGFAEADIAATRFQVSDRQADGYRADGKSERYVLTQTLTIRSTDIDRIARTSQEIGELARLGLALTGFSGPTYIFTADKLNTVKPDLIRRATAAARDAAEEFARTSNTAIGAIRNANQGVIAILAPDDSSANAEWGERSSPTKRIRAVTTVEYFLR